MRFFQISLLFIFLNSCSLTTTRGLVEQKIDKEYILNNYFSDEKLDYLYKAKINIYNKNFGGILIIKKIKKEHHRVVFTTEIGNKIFDFEIIGNDFKVNYFSEDLNKNIVLKTLEDDFRILVKQHINVNKQFSSEFEKIYQSFYIQNDNYYFYSKQTKQLSKIINTNKNKEKTVFSFNQVENHLASSIVLEHKNFKLKIDLTAIHK